MTLRQTLPEALVGRPPGVPGLRKGAGGRQQAVRGEQGWEQSVGKLRASVILEMVVLGTGTFSHFPLITLRSPEPCDWSELVGPAGGAPSAVPWTAPGSPSGCEDWLWLCLKPWFSKLPELNPKALNEAQGFVFGLTPQACA